MKRVGFVCLALVFLSACAGGSSTPGLPPGGMNGGGGVTAGALPPSLADRTLFVGLSTGAIQEYSESNGTMLGSISIPGSAGRIPTTMNLSSNAQDLFVTLSPLYNCTYGPSKVLELNASTGSVVNSVSSNDQFTYAVLSSDGSTLAALANYAVNNQGAESFAIDVFSTSTLQLVKSVRLPNYEYPYGLALSSDGSTAYVTAAAGGNNKTLYKVAIASGTISALHQFDTPFATLVFLDSAQTRLLVETSTSYAVIDPVSGAMTGSIGLPPSASFYEGSAQTADRGTIFSLLEGTSVNEPKVGAMISTTAAAVTNSFGAAKDELQSDVSVSPDGVAGFTFSPTQQQNISKNVYVYALPSGTLESTVTIPAGVYVSAVAGQ